LQTLQTDVSKLHSEVPATLQAGLIED